MYKPIPAYLLVVLDVTCYPPTRGVAHFRARNAVRMFF